jgi:hypothetical protein
MFAISPLIRVIGTGKPPGAQHIAKGVDEMSDYLKWFESNKYIFHWTVKAGIVEIISVYVALPDKKDAQRLSRALRYRGVEASTHWRSVSVRSRCGLGVFQAALNAAKIDWEDFKEWVSFLYFDGNRHIPDKAMSQEEG